MKTATMVRKAKISDATLTRILTEHKIDRAFWPEMFLLVVYGVRPGDELLRRLRKVGNYAKCLNAILAELSKECKHRFPPANYRPSSHRKAS
jgi:hypothetical protein